VHALGVEELVRGGQQALALSRLLESDRGHLEIRALEVPPAWTLLQPPEVRARLTELKRG
jgi:hypothetical protein